MVMPRGGLVPQRLDNTAETLPGGSVIGALTRPDLKMAGSSQFIQ